LRRAEWVKFSCATIEGQTSPLVAVTGKDPNAPDSIRLRLWGRACIRW
jgi:hypothetical protein